MPEKLSPTPRSSADFIKEHAAEQEKTRKRSRLFKLIANAFQVTTDQIIRPVGKRAQSARNAAFYLLTDPTIGLATNDDLKKIFENPNLTNADESIEKVRAAIEIGDHFGKVVGAIRANMLVQQGARAEQGATPEKEAAETQLMRLAEISFNVNVQAAPQAFKRQQRLARLAAILIASRCLGKNHKEIGALVDVTPQTAERMIQEAREEYNEIARKGSFRDRVQVICDEMGIKAP